MCVSPFQIWETPQLSFHNRSLNSNYVVLSFQNQTLRPILKQQNPLFLILFTNHIQTFKIPFAQMNEEQQNQCIANALAQNQPFKNTMIGIVVGWFTKEESNIYCQNRAAFNKRIVQMLIQRLQDQRTSI